MESKSCGAKSRGNLDNLETDPKNRRTDDNILTLQKRLAVYKEMTLPIISFYQERKKLIKINGMESIEEVNKKIISILN